MLCSVLIAALVTALVVVPFRPAPRLLAVAALALLVFWSRTPVPKYGVIQNHVPLGTNKPMGFVRFTSLATPNPSPSDMLHVPGDTPAPRKQSSHNCWDRNNDNDDAPSSLTSNYGLYVADPPIGATTTYGIHVESRMNNAKENLGELQKMQRKEDTIMAEIVRLTRETNQALADCFLSLEAFVNATSSYSKATEDLVSIWQTKPWYKRWFG